MSADIMLICHWRGEWNAGLHPEGAFLLGDTCRDEELSDEMLKILPPDHNLQFEDYPRGMMPSSVHEGKKSIQIHIIVEYKLDEELKKKILAVYRKHNGKFLERLRYWLSKHFDEQIGLEYW